MKCSVYVCLVAGALMSVTQAVAAPSVASLLSVDINGFQNPDGLTPPGPTEVGFQAWDLEDSLFAPWNLSTNVAGVSQIFATSEGNVTATLTGHTGGVRNARNRQPPQGGPLPSLRQDFVYATRNGDGFGQHWLKLELAGLAPGQKYELTGFAQDIFNGNGDPTLDNSSFQAWTDLAQLGGLDGPGAWMDTNVGVGALYQPAIGGSGNPIPTLGRAPISGPAPAAGEDYKYSASIYTTADAGGKVTVYTWSDPNGYSGTQTVSLINGFQIGAVPEPASLLLFGMGMIGLAVYRRRS